MNKTKARKFFEIAAIVAPLLIFGFVTVFSVFLPNYNPVSQYVSVLGSHISPFRLIVNVFGFGMFGLIMIATGYLFYHSFAKNHFGRTASRLLMGAGLLLMLLAVFPTDPDYTMITFEGQIHSLIGRVSFAMVPIAILWFGLAFEKDENWGKAWSYMSFILAFAALLSMGALGISKNFDGMIERLGMGADMFWLFVSSLNLYLIDKKNQVQKLVNKLNLERISI